MGYRSFLEIVGAPKPLSLTVPQIQVVFVINCECRAIHVNAMNVYAHHSHVEIP